MTAPLTLSTTLGDLLTAFAPDRADEHVDFLTRPIPLMSMVEAVVMAASEATMNGSRGEPFGHARTLCIVAIDLLRRTVEAMDRDPDAADVAKEADHG